MFQILAYIAVLFFSKAQCPIIETQPTARVDRITISGLMP